MESSLFVALLYQVSVCWPRQAVPSTAALAESEGVLHVFYVLSPQCVIAAIVFEDRLHLTKNHLKTAALEF